MFHGCFKVFPTFSRILGSDFFFTTRMGNSLLGNLPIQDLSRHEPSMNFLITPSHHPHLRPRHCINCYFNLDRHHIILKLCQNYPLWKKKHTVSICPKLDARPFWGRIHHFSEFLTISIKYATYTVSTYDMLDFGTIYDMYGTASTGGHSQAMKW